MSMYGLSLVISKMSTREIIRRAEELCETLSPPSEQELQEMFRDAELVKEYRRLSSTVNEPMEDDEKWGMSKR